MVYCSLCFFWREYICTVWGRKWAHPYSKHDSQNVWQQLMFGHFPSPLCTDFLENLKALLQHPWWFLCKSARTNVLAMPICFPVCFFRAILDISRRFLFSSDLYCYFLLFHHLLCEIRVESSLSSINLEDSNLCFLGHLNSEPMWIKTSLDFGIWQLSSSLYILLEGSRETKNFLTDAFHHIGRPVCMTVINGVVVRPFSFGLLKQ